MLDASSESLVMADDFPLVTDDGRRYRHLPLRNTNKKFNPVTAATLHFPVWGDPDTGAVATDPFPGAVEVKPVFGDGTPAVWRWSAPRIDARPDDLVCRRIRGQLGERVDIFQKDWLHEGRRKKIKTIWLAEEVGSTDTAVAELKALLGPVFESPKPTGLVRRVLECFPADARVLDFFAGSGTTGHATALANAADGGSRTCLSRELRRADPRGLQRPERRLPHRQCDHPGAAGAGRRDRRWRACGPLTGRVRRCGLVPNRMFSRHFPAVCDQSTHARERLLTCQAATGRMTA